MLLKGISRLTPFTKQRLSGVIRLDLCSAITGKPGTCHYLLLSKSFLCPCLCDSQSQLDAMKLNKLHAATMAPTPSHIKTREEKGEVRPHQRARRSSSDDNSRPKSAIPENRITTIPELTESFEKRLCVRDKRTISLVSSVNLNLTQIRTISVAAKLVVDYPVDCRFDQVWCTSVFH